MTALTDARAALDETRADLARLRSRVNELEIEKAGVSIKLYNDPTLRARVTDLGEQIYELQTAVRRLVGLEEVQRRRVVKLERDGGGQ